VSEADAPARTRQIFDEVRHALCLPVVPFLYQAYAAYPDFLAVHWQAFGPAIQSRQFFLLGSRLAADAYTRAHNYFEVPDFRVRPKLAEAHQVQPATSLATVLDYYQYLDPLQLLITAAQMQAFEGPLGNEQTMVQPDRHPGFSTPPSLIPDPAPSAIQHIWDDRRRLGELAAIPDEHRALAVWPDFYQKYWLALRDLVQSPLFNDGKYRIGESALILARDLPGPIETSVPHLLEAGLKEGEVSSLARINESLVHSLSAVLLDVVFARIGCEGGTSRVQQQPAVPSESSIHEGIGSPHRAA
jgi:hypothetical protein